MTFRFSYGYINLQSFELIHFSNSVPFLCMGRLPFSPFSSLPLPSTTPMPHSPSSFPPPSNATCLKFVGAESFELYNGLIWLVWRKVDRFYLVITREKNYSQFYDQICSWELTRNSKLGFIKTSLKYLPGVHWWSVSSINYLMIYRIIALLFVVCLVSIISDLLSLSIKILWHPRSYWHAFRSLF